MQGLVAKADLLGGLLEQPQAVRATRVLHVVTKGCRVRQDHVVDRRCAARQAFLVGEFDHLADNGGVHVERRDRLLLEAVIEQRLAILAEHNGVLVQVPLDTGDLAARVTCHIAGDTLLAHLDGPVHAHVAESGHARALPHEPCPRWIAIPRGTPCVDERHHGVSVADVKPICKHVFAALCRVPLRLASAQPCASRSCTAPTSRRIPHSRDRPHRPRRAES